MKERETKVIEMDLKTRQKIASGVVMNAKEIISQGKDGKEVKKIIALVPVSLIKVDHKDYQREERKHVIKMTKEWDDTQCTLLLVNYRSAEGWFYVIDGQHRTVAARILGIEYLPCEIFINLTVEEEARRFLYYNTGTKSLTPFDTFKANICWGEPNDVAIKEVCDKYNVTIIDRGKNKRNLRSVSIVRSIYRNGGTAALEWILKLIEEVHWEDFKETYSADILWGLSSVYMKYLGNLLGARKNLIAFMRNSNPAEIIGIASTEYPMQGHQTRARLVFEEIAGNDKKNPYNTRKIAHIA